MSDSLWPHGLQHARFLCPPLSPGVCSNSCPLSWWCHPTISSSAVLSPFALNLSQYQGIFQWVGSSHQWPTIGASALASVLPMNIQGWFPLGLTGFISLQYKEHSRVFSSITILKHQFFGAQPSLLPNSHIHTWLLERLLECVTAFLKQQLQQSYFPVSHSEQTLS